MKVKRLGYVLAAHTAVFPPLSSFRPDLLKSLGDLCSKVDEKPVLSICTAHFFGHTMNCSREMYLRYIVNKSTKWLCRVSSRFLSEGVQWGMCHKQPVPDAQTLKLGESGGMSPGNFCLRVS